MKTENHVLVGATVKKDGDVSEYKNNLILNIATVIINDDKPLNSNEVDIIADKVPEPVPAFVTSPKINPKQKKT